MKEAAFYQKTTDNAVICGLCPHNCYIKNGEKGLCKSRENQNGVLYTLNYGKTVSLNPYDPVEKKPLFHFLPGTQVLSIGANLCNLHCNYCQNYHISQQEVPTKSITKEELSVLVKNYGLSAVAYTYTEPVIWYEFLLDSAKFLTAQGIKTIMVTNGFINPEPLNDLLPYLSAMNIDLKAFNDDFYQRNCGGRLEPVLNTIKNAAQNTHLEITNLLISDENDSDEDIKSLIDFVASVDPRIPLHFSRYFPCYKLNNPPTDSQRLFYAYHEAKKKLSHVYLGNIPFDNILECEHCGFEICQRGYGENVDLANGICPNCGKPVYGIW